MSAYIFTLDSRETLELYAKHGVYATKITRPDSYWAANHLYTLGDYLTMRPGDLVFFFRDRKIYGIGRLVEFQTPAGSAVALCNYPRSYLPAARLPSDSSVLLWDEGDQADRPWVVFFEPCPCFFKEGLDMDEALDSDVRGVVRALRVFERVSFMQMTDEEAQLLSDLFVRRFAADITHGCPAGACFAAAHEPVHDRVRRRLRKLADYDIEAAELVRHYTNRLGRLRSEAVLELWLLDRLTRGAPEVSALLGDWDYVTHQLRASPAKPVQYMDRIDIFGYQQASFGTGFRPTTVKYKVAEVKRGALTGAVGEDTVNQLMRYVDWVTRKEAGGDYSMVDAYLFAHDFSSETLAYVRGRALREFVFQRRPSVSRTWHQVALLRYRYDPGPARLVLDQVYP